MEYTELLNRKKDLRDCILEYIDNQEKNDDQFTKLSNMIADQKIPENPDSLKSLLLLLNKISNDHHRSPNFFIKIDKIIIQLQDAIKQSFTNSDIFKIFSSNKRNLLLLFQKQIIDLDESILNLITTEFATDKNFTSYFYPELKDKLPNLNINMDDIDESDIQLFERKRKIGENDKFICELIRNDSIEEFIFFINKNSIPLTATIAPSIFETNSYLLKNESTLIEYAAFFGSIQIFDYLRLNKSELNNSILFYAIHGNNHEIVQCIEDQEFNYNRITRTLHFIEAVKCHHDDIANYINTKDLFFVDFSSLIGLSSMLVYLMNYSFYPSDIFNEYVFYQLCRYDQTELVNFVLNYPNYTNYININNRVIFKKQNNFF